MEDKKITILVVEDDEDWKDLIRETLEDKERYILWTYSILENAKKAHRDATTANALFDIVICDGSLQSRYDGLEWIKELHAKDQKVITFSNTSVEGIPQITKRGFDRKELINLINKLLNKK